MALVIGLNSGSSFDGMDAVLIDIELGEDGYPNRPRFIDGLAYQWPEKIAERVLDAFANKVSIFEMTRLHYEAGAVYAEAARELMRRNSLSGADVEVIGFDGQTIYQEPPKHELLGQASDESIVDLWHSGVYGCGLQIGEQAVVAAFCDAPTVSHFRPLDHALGGTGAPLMQFLDFCSFRDIGPVMTLNIGGIANCQLADADRDRMMAFDTGPGNVMIDHAMRKLYNEGYDRNGETAAKGNVNQTMLTELLSHPFFQRKPPRSAWRLDFGADYADRFMEKFKDLPGEDLVATFTRFTALAILQSIRDNVSTFGGINEVIASGGGVLNATLMGQLAELFREEGVELVTSDKYGIPPQYKEAIKFATLAYANINNMASNIPAASGAKSFGTLGKLVKAPRQTKV